jgi:hypothetical protein
MLRHRAEHCPRTVAVSDASHLTLLGQRRGHEMVQQRNDVIPDVIVCGAHDHLEEVLHEFGILPSRDQSVWLDVHKSAVAMVSVRSDNVVAHVGEAADDAVGRLPHPRSVVEKQNDRERPFPVQMLDHDAHDAVRRCEVEDLFKHP